jgi:hypothetical protein
MDDLRYCCDETGERGAHSRHLPKRLCQAATAQPVGAKIGTKRVQVNGVTLKTREFSQI